MSASWWHYGTIKEVSGALAARRISASELLELTIARIEALDERINAVVVRDFERAREAARAADMALARGERRALLGIPFTVKEAINVAGLPTTWGFPEFKDFVANEDAVIVSRVKTEGAVLLGKTNVPLGLGDFQSYNDIYGTTNNPWDISRSPGGSSGGSAAALATGFGLVSFGSDIGGSLRVPAHFCGVYAHKPTYGLVPFRGYNRPPDPPLPVNGDLAVIGPLARTAADLATALDVIAGPDQESEGIGYRLALPPARHRDLRKFRVVVIDCHPLMPTDDAVRSAFNQLAGRLGKVGVKLSQSSDLLPNLADSARIYMRLVGAARSAGTPPDVYERTQSAAAALQPGDLATERVRGTVTSHREWLATDQARERLKEQCGLMRTVARSAFSFHIAIRTRVSKRGPSARYTECPCSRCMYGRADSSSARLHLGPPRQACVSSSFGHPAWGNPRVREPRDSRSGRWPNSPEPSPEEEDFQTQGFQPNQNSRSSIGLRRRCRTDRSRPRVKLLCLLAECLPSGTRSHSSALRAASAA
jgi:amidase